MASSIDTEFAFEQEQLLALEKNIKDTTDVEELKIGLRAILAKYPLLFGYWAQLTQLDSTTWDAALEACPSLELWAAYVARPDTSTERFDRAIDAVGFYFQSHVIWDAYLEFVKGDPEKYAAVLLHAIQTPLYEYAKYITAARELLAKTPQAFADQDLDLIFSRTAEVVGRRWEFESMIERTYFHVVPIKTEELEVWDRYLDWAEQEVSTKDLQGLYLQCIMVTALYPGFWMRLIRWRSGTNPDLVNSDIQKALLYARARDELDSSEKRTRLLAYKAIFLESIGHTSSAEALLPSLGDSRSGVNARVQYKIRQQAPSETLPLAERECASLYERADVGLPDDSAVLFTVSDDLERLFKLWEQGICPDSAAFAKKLRDAGDLEKFFKVDLLAHSSLSDDAVALISQH